MRHLVYVSIWAASAFEATFIVAFAKKLEHCPSQTQGLGHQKLQDLIGAARKYIRYRYM